MIPEEDLPPLTLHIGPQTFVSTNYGWIGDDFYFDTEDGQTIKCEGMYVTNIRYHGLEYDSTEEMTITMTKEWGPSA